MKATVRDDIIGIDSYVDAEFKYKKYIEIIYECGGYCFLDQFERLWKNEGGKYLAKKMEDAKLIKSDYYSNYKYIRLADNALKYLRYRNDTRDFTDVPKNKIAIQKLKKKPSEKVLFTSAMYFELTQSNKSERNIFLKKKNQIEILNKVLKIDNTPLINEKRKYLEELETELDRYNFLIEKFSAIFANTKIVKGFSNEMESVAINKKKYLEDKRNLFKSNEKEIREIEEQLNIIQKITEQSQMNDTIIRDYNIKKNGIEEKIKETKKTITNLRKQELSKDRATEEKIKKLIIIRDISKCICIPTNSNGKNRLMFFSVFPNTPKSNYTEIIDDAMKILDDIHIDELYFCLISVKDITKKVENVFKKIKNHMNKIRYYNIEVITEYHHLPELKKYSDLVTDKISYIKEDDIENFEKLREKLSGKK